MARIFLAGKGNVVNLNWTWGANGDIEKHFYYFSSNMHFCFHHKKNKKDRLFKNLGYIQKCNYLEKVSSALRDYVWVDSGKRGQMNKASLQIILSKTY